MHKYKILEYKPIVNIKFNEMILSEADLKKIDERLEGFDERTFLEYTILESFGIDLGNEYQEVKAAYGIKQSMGKQSIKWMHALEYLSKSVSNDSYMKDNKEMMLISVKALALSTTFNKISGSIHKLASNADEDLDYKSLEELKLICDIALSNEIYVFNSISNIKSIISEKNRINNAITKCYLLGDEKITGILDINEVLEEAIIKGVINGNTAVVDAVNMDLPNTDEYRRLYQILLTYNLCINQLKESKTSAIDSINTLIELVGTEFDHVDTTSRIGLLCILIIREKYSFYITKTLLNDSQDTLNYYFSSKNLFIKYWQSLKDQQYKPINDYISEPKPVSRDWVTLELLPILKVWLHSANIRNLLGVTSFDNEYAYYTSYETFSLMLPEKCVDDRADECGRLSIMNVGYMNDPNEGLILKQYLYDDNYKNKSPKSVRKLISSPFVFIKCFTSMIDYLPMWKMYGEGGDNKQSVCLVVDLSNIKDALLYHVCYMDKSNKRNPVLKAHNRNIDYKEVSSSLKEIKNMSKSVTSDEGHSCLEKILSDLNYMFKDSSYSYEQEIRLMYKYDTSVDTIKKTKQNPKKLFIPSKEPVQINEIILGPRFENVSEYYPYLQEQLEKMAEKTKTNVPKVTLSSIDYR